MTSSSWSYANSSSRGRVRRCAKLAATLCFFLCSTLLRHSRKYQCRYCQGSFEDAASSRRAAACRGSENVTLNQWLARADFQNDGSSHPQTNVYDTGPAAAGNCVETDEL